MNQQGPQLRRQLGLLDAIAIVLGAMIGAGIFVAIGQAAGAAGAALPLAVLIASVGATFSALSAAELGAFHPRVGGPYEVGYALLSPVAGFAAGWTYLVANLVASAAYTLGFADYLEPLAPGLPLRAIAVALTILIIAVNLAGVQQSRRLNDVLVAIKTSVLVLFVLVGLAALGQWDLRFFAPVQLSGLPRASALMFFAFAGFGRALTLAGEIRDPGRNLPRSIIIGLAVSALLYFAVTVVGVGLVGPGGLSQTPAPLRTALGPTGQAWAQVVVSLGALIAMVDILLVNVWGLSRVVFAMARRGDLPRVFQQLDRRGLPRPAVLAVGAIIVPLSALLAFGPAIAASSLGQLVYYGITNAAALQLTREQRLYPPALPLVGILFSVGLAFSLPLESLIVVGAALGAGFIYYALRHRWIGGGRRTG